MLRVSKKRRNYALVTAAYNEERYIAATIDSVISQSVLPVCWVIVSDASTDHTDEIVEEYSKRHNFIKLVRLTDDHPRDFAAQVNAINTGVSSLSQIKYEFIGNLDADVSFSSCYFQDLLAEFSMDPRLGLAGGSIWEEKNGVFAPRPLNRSSSVAHAVQLFRRECFEELGGYIALPYGGPDWYAGVRSRMNGWGVRSVENLEVYHHRKTGGASSWSRSSYRQGCMDFSLGSHPLFELFRIGRRLQSPPICLNALVRLFGFASRYLRGERRIVPPEFVAFLRKEEKDRFLQSVRRVLGVSEELRPS